MDPLMRSHADTIVAASIHAVLPDEAVKRALSGAKLTGRIVLVAAGKAAWQMAQAAAQELGERIYRGVVVTKYDHVRGEIPGVTCYEAGHPVPDENSYRATQAAINAVTGLSKEDTVLFLLSGGGSALFEKPLIPAEDLTRLTKELLACGADIVEMNTVRKRFSAVKGGKFAVLCAPARVEAVVLSDIIGDPLDMIASGPAYPDSSTAADAKAIAEKYHLTLTEQMRQLLEVETPKTLDNVNTQITGSVKELCKAAAEACRELGYTPMVLTASLSCTARDAGVMLANIAQYHAGHEKPLAFLMGGETVVHLTGKGKGGRNQELALAAAPGIAGQAGVCVFSLGSDGTDGPTDAAGGYADGDTCATLKEQGIEIYQVLQDNDAYHALEKSGGLIKTGATGTNVNDVSILLMR